MNAILEFQTQSRSDGARGRALPELRSGELISVKVVKLLAGSFARVGIRGKLYTVSSQVPLATGATLRAQLFRAPGKVFIRVVPEPKAGEDPARSLLRTLKLPDDPLARLALEAIQRLGLAISAPSVAALRFELSRSRAASPRLARLLALMLDKHIPLSSELVDELYRLSEAEEPFGEDDRSSDRAPKEPGSAEPIAPAIAASLKRQLSGASKEVAREGDDSPLLLLNHLSADHQNWVVLPFSFSRSGVEISGSLRLLFDPRKRPIRCTIVVKPASGSPGMAFELRPGAKRSMTLHAEPGLASEAGRHLSALKENLRNLGVEVDDIIKVFDQFDGFSSDGVASGPVDWVM